MFRKTVKCSDKCHFHGANRFVEIRPKKVINGSSECVSLELAPVTMSELSDEAVPLLSVSSAVKTPITGNVDFSPSDPANLGSVESVLESYLDVVSSNVVDSSESSDN